MNWEPVLLDTNILLRWIQPEDPGFAVIDVATQRLERQGAEFCYTSQNLGEFWNSLTRPLNRNGYGLTPEEADLRAASLESRLRLLPDNPDVHYEWRRLLVAYRVSGVQVHDARLVASMHVHGVKTILTFNARDFARFTDIEALHPSQIHQA